MRILIIEDEDAAVQRLKNILAKIDADFEVIGDADSIESSVELLQRKDLNPELILSDIHLADGLSFEIFSKVETNCPVIFITAYDQYAIEAFKLNSIDYLLKPLKKAELERSIRKYEKLKKDTAKEQFDYKALMHLLKQDDESFPKRLLVKYGQNMKAIEINDIAYFFTENKIVFLVTFEKQKFAVDYNLESLENILDRDRFFRVNRQFIVNISAIERMITISKSRFKIYLKPPVMEEAIVSVERSPNFKKWLTGSGST